MDQLWINSEGVFLQHPPERLLITIDHICLEPKDVAWWAWCQHARRFCGSKDGTSAKMASQASTLQGSARELLKHAETHSYWGLPQGIHLIKWQFHWEKIAIDNPLELCFSLSLSLHIVFGTAVPYFALCSDKSPQDRNL